MAVMLSILAQPAKDDNDRALDLISIATDRRFIGRGERDDFFWLRVQDNIPRHVRDNIDDQSKDGSKRFMIPLTHLMKMVIESNAGIYGLTEVTNGRTFQAHIQTDLVSGNNVVLQVMADATGHIFDKNEGVFY